MPTCLIAGDMGIGNTTAATTSHRGADQHRTRRGGRARHRDRRRGLGPQNRGGAATRSTGRAMRQPVQSRCGAAGLRAVPIWRRWPGSWPAGRGPSHAGAAGRCRRDRRRRWSPSDVAPGAHGRGGSAGHRSTEPAHTLALAAASSWSRSSIWACDWVKAPVPRSALPVVRAAIATLTSMATFDSSRTCRADEPS